MNLVKVNDDVPVVYLDMDKIESIVFYSDELIKVFVTGSLDPYLISKKAYDIMLKYGKAPQ